MAAEKIKQLRKWMNDYLIDAFIVPHADRFQSEYLPPEEERLAWLTGFDGSNGTAIITRDAAVLFTDGRYTLQAAKQLDTKIYEIVEELPGQTDQWLMQKLQSGAVVALDPWLMSVNQARRWQKIAEENDWTIQWLEKNPIDALWTDRPAAAVRPAFAHPIKYTGKRKEEKIDQLLKKISPRAERLLIADPGLVCWLLNIRGADVAHVPLLHAQAILDKDGHVTVFTNPDKIPDKLKTALGNSVSIEGLSWLQPVLGNKKAAVQLDPKVCPFALYEYCVTQNVPVIEATDPAVLMRATKNWVEIKGAETAQEKDKKAFAVFQKWYEKRDFAKEKITELDIVTKLRECRAADPDFIEESFETISGFGPNGAIVHYSVTEKTNLRLRGNNLLLLDSGGQYACGTTDITRVFPVGKPTAEMKKHYTAVLKGLIALSTARFPAGTSGAQLDALARRPIWDLGLDYAHGTGHGIGSFMSVHEGPQGFSYRGQAPLVEGMIISIEPGIYLEGQYGIRLENLVVVVADKLKKDKETMLAFKTLTKVPFEKKLIDWKMLTDAEENFLLQFGTKRK